MAVTDTSGRPQGRSSVEKFLDPVLGAQSLRRGVDGRKAPKLRQASRQREGVGLGPEMKGKEKEWGLG